MAKENQQNMDDRVTNPHPPNIEEAREEVIDQIEDEVPEITSRYLPSEDEGWNTTELGNIESAAKVLGQSKSHSNTGWGWKNGRDPFQISIPVDHVLERWELKKNFTPVVNGDANVAGSGPKRGSKGTIRIDVDWWVQPFNTIRYNLDVYTVRQLRTIIIYFGSHSWDERARQMIAQKVPFYIRISGRIALDIWNSLNPFYKKIESATAPERLGAEAQSIETPQLEMNLIGGFNFIEGNGRSAETGGIEVEPIVITTAIVVGGLTAISAILASVIMVAILNGYDPKAVLTGVPGSPDFRLDFDIKRSGT